MRISKRRAKLLIINGSLATPVEAFELRLMTTITTTMPTTTAPPCRPCAAHTRFGISIGFPPSVILFFSHSLCPTVPLPHFRSKGDAEKQTKLFVVFVLRFMTQREVHDIESGWQIDELTTTTPASLHPRKSPTIVHSVVATGLFSPQYPKSNRLFIARINDAVLLLHTLYDVICVVWGILF